MNNAGTRMAASEPDGAPDVAPAAMDTRPQRRGLAVIVAIFVGLLIISLAASWAAIDVVNSTRAYATGEGRYSKAQKIAVLNLHRYAYSGSERDYWAFRAATQIPLGDRDARVALESTPVDTAAAADGFLRGDNHPDDIAGMIRLFRGFSWWSPFAAAVADWREGDALVAELIAAGEALHQRIAAGNLDGPSQATMLARIDRIDDRLTELENTFSTHMGEAARMATLLVVLGLGAATIVLWAAGMGFAARLFRAQLRLDRKLGASERRFRDYAEVASDWYWETDAQHRVTYISERFLELGGDEGRGTLGRHAGGFIREHASEQDSARALAAIEARQPFRDLRLRQARADGSAIYWSIAGKPATDAAGRFIGYRGVGGDITATVLDGLVLREAKERAEVANRAKSEFLANMSHELRTPLNAILGFSEIIINKLFGPQAIDRYAAYAGDIHASGRHLLAIIDDVLDLSKVEAGRAELSARAVALEQIVAASHRIMAERYSSAGLALFVETPTPSPELMVDERKIKQCLVNLLSNALKFTPRGGSVILRAAVAPDGGVTLQVADTGIGIAAADIETVLAPFGQVESAFSRNHHGTGLGLPLAKSLMELHGGGLTLASTPGAGTTVTLWLPPSCLAAARQAA